MSCACEAIRMNRDRQRVRSLARKAAALTGEAYIIYQDERTKEYRFIRKAEANGLKILEIVI